MIVRFDEALPLAARIIREALGPAATERGVLLRDVTGRLSFFCPDELAPPTQKALDIRLRTELGAYARPDRVLALPSDFGADEILREASTMRIAVAGGKVRLLDRRLVGADWLRRPPSEESTPPKFVFASLKGGVGRSTALSVVAAHLAEKGLRVLAVDLDLEAPGLGSLLLDTGTVPEFGVLDALVENGISGIDNHFLADLTGPSALAGRRGRIDVAPAFGRKSLKNPADVLAKIARAYVDDISDDGQTSTLLDQVRTLVDRLSQAQRYDVVLVDARAGLHETTAAAILGLSADVLFFGLNERQTFEGYNSLFSHLGRLLETDAVRPSWLDRLTFVHGKASLDDKARDDFVERCRSMLEQCGLSKREQEQPLPSAPIPAAPFNDVPWDDSISDDEALSEDRELSFNVLTVLDDQNFRNFDPLQRRELTTETAYLSAYGSLLAYFEAALYTQLAESI